METKTNDELYKEQKKRRSSILKVPKPRNPLEEIDLTENATDILRPPRRVSFASSNFIKPFAADPEKNTIWDTTYEEDLNHTNSTQSSQEQNQNSTTQRSITSNPTFLNSHVELPLQSISLVEYANNQSANGVQSQKPDIKIFEDVDAEVKITNDTMELTCYIPEESSKKASFTRNEVEMEFTCQMLKEQRILTKSYISDAVKSSNDSAMEFTCQIPNLTENRTNANLSNIENFQESMMEFTCQIPQKNLTESHISPVIGDTIRNLVYDSEIENIPQLRLKKNMKSTAELIGETLMESDSQVLPKNMSNVYVSENDCGATSKSLNNSRIISTIKISEDFTQEMPMEITCQIPQKILTKRSVLGDICIPNTNTKMSNDSEMEFTCQVQKNVTQETSVKHTPNLSNVSGMELTYQTPQETRRKSTVTVQQTPMEFTCQSPQKNLPKSYIFDKGDETAPKLTVDSEMEFTRQSQEKNATQQMEFTCQIPQKSLRSCISERVDGISNLSNVSEMTSSREMQQKSKTNGTESRMEFTCQIPQRNLTKSYVSEKEDKTIPKLSGMEFTLQSQEKNATQNNSVNANQQMEFTCQIPQKSCISGRVDGTYSNLSNVSDFTSNRETHQKPKANGKENTIQESRMEFTCQIPQRNLTKSYVSENDDKTVPKLSNVSEMEFTCQVPQEPKNSTLPVCQQTPTKFTCQIPEKKFVSGIPKKVRTISKLSNVSEMTSSHEKQKFKANDAENTVQESRMEFTCQIPQKSLTKSCVSEKGDVTIPKLSNVTEMEFTRQIQQTTTIQNNSMNSTRQMEFTCQISPKVYNSEGAGRITSKLSNVSRMELSQPLQESVVKSTADVTKEMPMEFTCQIPPIPNLSNVSEMTFTRHIQQTKLKVIKDLVEDTPMEFTCQIQQNLTKDLASIKLSNDSKMEFNRKMESPAQVPRKKAKKNDVSKCCTNLLDTNETAKITDGATCQTSSFNITMEDSKIDLTGRLPSDLLTQKGAFQTREPSFHLSLTPDTTQHLLQCTYSAGVPMLHSRRDETSVMVKMDDTGHMTKPILTNFDETMKNNSMSVSINDVPRACKLSNINDTYVLKNKTNKNNVKYEENSYYNDESSLGIVPDDCIQADHTLVEDNVRNPIKIQLREIDLNKFKQVPELKQLQERINKSGSYIKKSLENFKLKPTVIPKLMSAAELLRQLEEGTKQVPKSSSLLDKIRKREESCHKAWKFESVQRDNVYRFSTLFETLVFDVESNELDQVVRVKTVDKLSRSAKPLARFILRYFWNKLSAISRGDGYTIFTFLKFVEQIMWELMKFQCEFFGLNTVSVEDSANGEAFIAKFKIFNFRYLLCCDILVDVGDICNVSHRDVQIVCKHGSISEAEVKLLIQNTKKGLEFFSSFKQNIDEFIKVKCEKNKHLN